MVEEYTGTLASEHIPASVLAMLDDAMMDKRFMMPLSFDEASGTLSIITSRFEGNFLDSEIILSVVQKKFPQVKRIHFLACEYNNFYTGYMAHYNKKLYADGSRAADARQG